MDVRVINYVDPSNISVETSTNDLPDITSSNEFMDLWMSYLSSDSNSFLEHNTYSYEENNYDPKPLLRYIQKKFPFVLDITKIERKTVLGYNPIMYDTTINEPFRVYLKISSIHFSEIRLDFTTNQLLTSAMVEHLHQLINCMYSGVDKNSIEFIFETDKGNEIRDFITKNNLI